MDGGMAVVEKCCVPASMGSTCSTCGCSFDWLTSPGSRWSSAAGSSSRTHAPLPLTTCSHSRVSGLMFCDSSHSLVLAGENGSTVQRLQSNLRHSEIDVLQEISIRRQEILLLSSFFLPSGTFIGSHTILGFFSKAMPVNKKSKTDEV